MKREGDSVARALSSPNVSETAEVNNIPNDIFDGPMTWTAMGNHGQPKANSALRFPLFRDLLLDLLAGVGAVGLVVAVFFIRWA